MISLIKSGCCTLFVHKISPRIGIFSLVPLLLAIRAIPLLRQVPLLQAHHMEPLPLAVGILTSHHLSERMPPTIAVLRISG